MMPVPPDVTIAEAVRDGAVRLAGVAENPRHEARLLLAHALRLTQNDLIRDPARKFNPTVFDGLVRRRVAHEPIALIIGRREFWSMTFQVSPATLVPRPDSETVIAAAVAAFCGRRPPDTILDLGTGTGCLLLALLTEFPSAFGIGVDLGVDATVLAKTNAVRLGLIDRCAFLAGNWTSALKGRFDLIVSNPPYIPRAEISALMPEVSDHEPHRALDGGIDGYDAYRAIIPSLRQHLQQNGATVLEVGYRQAKYVGELAREAEFQVSQHLDLAQVPRAVILARPNR